MYLSQDPIGLAGNNPTLYGYVNNPCSELDFLGLDSFPFIKLSDSFIKNLGLDAHDIKKDFLGKKSSYSSI
jgi:uncharacterized protein RhaS with RHS repeats